MGGAHLQVKTYISSPTSSLQQLTVLVHTQLRLSRYVCTAV